MLGYYRFVLAFGVVLAHASLLPGSVSRTMVAAFFIISGYVIGLTLNANYRRNPIPFYWNRVLRIYPLHGIVLAIVLIAYGAGGADAVTERWTTWRIPTPGDGEIVRSFLLARKESHLFNPPAWSLFYELAFYVVAPLLALGRGSVWAVAAALTVLALVSQDALGRLDEPFGINDFDRESLAVAASLFLLGLGVFHFRRVVRRPFGRWSGAAEAVALAVPVALFVWSLRWVAFDDPAQFDASYGNEVYVTMVAATILLLLASNRDGAWSARASDLTYPIYLTHWPIIFILLGEQTHLVELQRWAAGAVDPLARSLTGSDEAAAIIVTAALAVALTLAVSQLWLMVERRTFQRVRASHRIPPSRTEPAALPEVALVTT